MRPIKGERTRKRYEIIEAKVRGSDQITTGELCDDRDLGKTILDVDHQIIKHISIGGSVYIRPGSRIKAYIKNPTAWSIFREGYYKGNLEPSENAACIEVLDNGRIYQRAREKSFSLKDLVE